MINPNLTYCCDQQSYHKGFGDHLFIKFNAIYKKDIWHGWVTTTLYNLLNNKFLNHLIVGEDQIFNYRTILNNFDFYVCDIDLAIYCQKPRK